MVLSEEIITLIKQQALMIKHGRIIIEINESTKKIDVITENRERFPDIDVKDGDEE